METNKKQEVKNKEYHLLKGSQTFFIQGKCEINALKKAFEEHKISEEDYSEKSKYIYDALFKPMEKYAAFALLDEGQYDDYKDFKYALEECYAVFCEKLDAYDPLESIAREFYCPLFKQVSIKYLDGVKKTSLKDDAEKLSDEEFNKLLERIESFENSPKRTINHSLVKLKED